jgi:hypothetical protein
MASMTTLLDSTKIETRLFINNEFVDSLSGKKFDTVDPATEQVICSVQEAGAADVDIAVGMSTCVCESNRPNDLQTFCAIIQYDTEAVYIYLYWSPRVDP